MLKYFDRYIIKELIPPSLIGLLIYTFVLLMNHILQLAEIFITRGISLHAAVDLLVFLIPSILAFTVPMSVLMGVLGGLSRLSSDSEIVAFKTLGISYKRLLRPVLVYSFAMMILTSFLTLYLVPRANFKWVQAFSQSVMERVQLKISPKEFNESIPHTVIFFQGMTKERVWENVFVYLSDPDKEPIAIVAKKGRLNVYSGVKRAVLSLSAGVLHSYSPSDPEKYAVTSFENLEEEINVENLFLSVSEEKRVREKDIHELIKDVRIVKQDLDSLEKESGRKDEHYQRKWKEHRSYWVEIHKKFAFPFTCLIFGLLALPLGASTRKGGRTSGFTISLGIITIYYVLITAGEKTAMDGKLPSWLGLWGANILLLLVALYLFFRSIKESSLFSLPSFLKRKKESIFASKRKKFSWNLPRLSLRFPNILDRYIIRKYLAIFLLVFFSLLVIFIIVTFFERIDNIYEHNKPIGLLLEYIRYSLPEFIHYIFPVAALTTVLLSLGILTKFNEITAMKTCGLSLYRIILPVVFLAGVLSFFSYFLQENILPY